jgi:outer membrane protein OmpA-like peptidoglycan-associated protein
MKFLSRFIVLCLHFFCQTPCLAQVNEGGALRLLDIVNSGMDDYSPCFTPDGKGIFFSRKNQGETGNGSSNYEILFTYSLQQGKWSVPRKISALSNKNENLVGFISDDGVRHYVQGIYKNPKSGKQESGIFVFQKQGQSWKLREKLNIPYFKNKSRDQSFCMYSGETVIVISMEHFNTEGVEDLYVSTKEPDGSWTELKNLGKTINTKFEEFYPWLDSDSRTLYFSSNGFPTLGSKDIFVSYRLDDTWTNWTPPLNLGEKVNSEGMDLAFRRSPIDADHFLMVSAQSSEGHSDLYQYFLPDSILPHPTRTFGINLIAKDPIEIQSQNIHISDQNKIRVTAKNKNNGHSIPFKTEIFDAKNIFLDSGIGNIGDTLEFKIFYDTVYLKVQSPGHLSIEKRIIFSNQRVGITSLETLALDSLISGKVIQLENVLFVKGTPKLLPSSFLQLDRVIEFLEHNSSKKILLLGHTDTAGDRNLNQILSDDRAKAVKSYLVKNGIKGNRINTRGFGGSKPLSNKRDEGSKQRNRRVEFLIM